ncbi:hypothetical protein HU200_009609 [Digitaria exilis]|uniref:Uncharacterized protein n=1 Tax=Digitaria exilis TaxID=1010633 RepID=A0A835FLN4_9POAL|nr:hypothetical protein HU200_009609 [Digitaria exilis]
MPELFRIGAVAALAPGLRRRYWSIGSSWRVGLVENCRMEQGTGEGRFGQAGCKLYSVWQRSCAINAIALRVWTSWNTLRSTDKWQLVIKIGHVYVVERSDVDDLIQLWPMTSSIGDACYFDISYSGVAANFEGGASDVALAKLVNFIRWKEDGPLATPSAGGGATTAPSPQSR